MLASNLSPDLRRQPRDSELKKKEAGHYSGLPMRTARLAELLLSDAVAQGKHPVSAAFPPQRRAQGISVRIPGESPVMVTPAKSVNREARANQVNIGTPGNKVSAALRARRTWARQTTARTERRALLCQCYLKLL